MALLGACGGGVVRAVATSADAHSWQHARRLALTSRNRLLALVLTPASRLAPLFPARLRGLIARNRLFVLVLIPAFLLRVDTELGYRWQVWFNDSFVYMSDVIGLHPDVTPRQATRCS